MMVLVRTKYSFHEGKTAKQEAIHLCIVAESI